MPQANLAHSEILLTKTLDYSVKKIKHSMQLFPSSGVGHAVYGFCSGMGVARNVKGCYQFMLEVPLLSGLFNLLWLQVMCLSIFLRNAANSSYFQMKWNKAFHWGKTIPFVPLQMASLTFHVTSFPPPPKDVELFGVPECVKHYRTFIPPLNLTCKEFFHIGEGLVWLLHG